VSSLLSNVEAYKVDAAVSLARDVIASGGRPLLLTTRKATAAALGEALQCPVVDGDTPPQERQAILAAAPCGAATMYSVTTGIDLVGYDHVIFTGLDWIPATLLQAEARAHRIGQLRHVHVHYLIGMGTLDEIVRERVIDRLGMFEAVIGGAEGDEAAMAQDLGGGSEDLIAGIVTAARESVAA